MTGISKETFHSGFNVFDIVGVDCLASPNVTTKYCPEAVSTFVDLAGSRSLPGRVSAYRIACTTTIFRRKVSTLIETYHDVPGQRDSGQVARGSLRRRGAVNLP